MAKKIIPCGGWYIDENTLSFDENKVLSVTGGGGAAGVASFNGRTGAVVPQAGDYTAEQVGAVSLSGGTLTGALNMGNNKITMGATPTATTDVTNKGYVDGVVKVVSDEVDAIIAGTTPISVPIATDTKVGGVKIGAGLSVDGEGTLSTAQTYLSTQGGTMDANAVVNGTNNLELSVGDASQSAVVGITQNGVTIEHNTNSNADSSIRAIDNAIEITANNTTVTVNGTGVALGGAAISGVNSLAGQPSTEIAIESDVDMNSHNLTNVGEISIANGLNIKADSGFTVVRDSNGILLSGENSGEGAGVMIGPENEQVAMQVVNGSYATTIYASKTTMGSDPAIIIGTQYDGSSIDPSGGGMIINGDSTINFTSPQPINFNNNRLTGIANPTAGSDAVNLTYFQSNLPEAPGNATFSTPGLVKQIHDMQNLSAQATLADVIDAFNKLLGYLRQAGIMVMASPS